MKKSMLTLAVVLAMTLTACGSTGGAATESSAVPESSAAESAAETTEASSEAAAQTTEAGNDELKIAIVSSPSGVDDGSFNEDNYLSLIHISEPTRH